MNELLTLGPGAWAIMILLKNPGPGKTGMKYSQGAETAKFRT